MRICNVKLMSSWDRTKNLLDIMSSSSKTQQPICKISSAPAKKQSENVNYKPLIIQHLSNSIKNIVSGIYR